ncbi:protein Star-like [Penaeus japonicus]|uniref:protein Star-like n=1 Tax=Penaeus japonicus TaxID=27405 RepID=UPI001C71279C|nr:protein Star-like [Penaeus japonicus]
MLCFRYLSASQEFIGEQVQKLINASEIELNIRELAKGEPGTFFEAGAYDGEFLSNTLWLEVESGWRGLLVEPNPDSFSRLLSKGRRRSWAINSCLSTSSRVSTMYLNLHVVPEERAGNISADYWRSSSRGREMPASQVWQGVVKAEVPCLPLYSILAAASMTSLDFLSLDVEFVEMGVLSSLPWDEVDIKVLAIEHLTEEDLEGFMGERGYRLFARQGEDWVFIKRKYFVVN